MGRGDLSQLSTAISANWASTVDVQTNYIIQLSVNVDIVNKHDGVTFARANNIASIAN